MKKLYVFTIDNCNFCKNLKDLLLNENIDYFELNIKDNQNIWNEVKTQTGYDLLPTIYITQEGKNEGLIFVPMRDYKDNNQCLELIKQYL